MIRTLSVENYKSLASAAVSLGPLVALVGPNASGKSNIVDALQLLRDLTMTVHTRTTVGSVIEARGGYQSVVWGGETHREVSLAVEWEPSPRAGGADYSIRLGLEQGQAVVKAEAGHLPGVISFQRDDAGHSVTIKGDEVPKRGTLTSVHLAALHMGPN